MASDEPRIGSGNERESESAFRRLRTLCTDLITASVTITVHKHSADDAMAPNTLGQLITARPKIVSIGIAHDQPESKRRRALLTRTGVEAMVGLVVVESTDWIQLERVCREPGRAIRGLILNSECLDFHALNEKSAPTSA